MAAAEPDGLTKDLQSAEFLNGEIAGFWKYLKRVGDRVYIAITAWDGDHYLIELTCDNYSVEPCLGRFVDPESLACVESAWPQGNETFGAWFKWQPANFFICWPGDRGGIAHHADWRQQKYWQQTGNPLAQYMEFLRTCLTVRGNGYRPRNKL